ARPVRGPLEVHIHFWLGSEASTDEAAVAAIKSVELDTALGGSPVQHRETEGHESARFKGYFKNGIRLMKGGVKGGLRKVTDAYKPTLFQVKGKRQIVVRELAKVDWSEMNDGDVFVLASKNIVFVWTGRYSNNSEKLQAAKFAGQLKAERGCSGSVVILEEGQESALQGAERAAFEELLPLHSKNVKSHTSVPQDEVFARQLASDLKLYRCSDESKTLKITEVKTGPLFQEDLVSYICQDAFIIDNGTNGIWVWIGKKASAKERQEAMRNALGFVAKKGYSPNTRTTRVIDGGEPQDFQSLFKNWKVKSETKVTGFKPQITRQASFAQPIFQAQTLHERPDVAAATQMVDDGSGQKEIWRINKFNLEPVPENKFGEFYMGDCYVILYAYSVGTKENYIVYHWQGLHSTADEQGTAAARAVELDQKLQGRGLHSTADEQGTAAARAVELDQKLQGRAVLVRVVQGMEPSHFMAIFRGKMVVYEGGHSSGFKSLSEREVSRKSTYTLQVRGTTKFNTKAVEVMNPTIVMEGSCYLPSSDPTIVMEGREPEEFWKTLGGKEAYASVSALAKGSDNDHPPRLFHCSNASGVFTAQEVLNFSQGDLVEDDVMLLDTWEAVFIWLGVNCNKTERVTSQSLAVEYILTDPRGRSPDTPIVLVKQGYEPPNFTGFFGVWDNDLWNNNMTYEDICERLQQSSPGCTVLVTPSRTVGDDGQPIRRTYPVAILRIKDGEKLPDDVDPTRKEDYMSDDDFRREFGMEREAFNGLAEWKRQNLKKKLGFY
ncbi:LOW QUALITY PROTEIN: advillin-like, partial [Hyalella azteca]|uniref:LOW QUALITY PROTEIN: advillin-like n=1 Tax=Hyalella azteca TaxID=294128 RepID=A0A8B7P454_HYAAZ